jgi:hypothetical protein
MEGEPFELDALMHRTGLGPPRSPRLTPKVLWPITSVVETLATFAYLFHGLVDFAVLLIDLGVTIVLISGRRPTDAARGGPLGIGSRRSG